MSASLTPDVARAALALRRSHPRASAREVLDVCLQGCTGAVDDLGLAIDPGQPFALLVAEAFDTGMAACDWDVCMRPGSDPVVQATLRQVWADEVLPKFAAAYGLAL